MNGASQQSGARVRLAFGPFLLRSFAVLALTGELALWSAIRRRAGGFPAGIRLAWLIEYTPRILFLAFVAAAALTLVADLFVRAVLGSTVRRWLSPRTDREDDAGRGFAFHLDATERVIDAVPGRKQAGWRSEPGSLVLTDRRVWFFPSTWDGEPWSAPRDRVRSAVLEPYAGLVGGVVRGLPDRLRLDTGPGPDAPATFALAEPARVRSWFAPEPAGPPRPSPAADPTSASPRPR